MRSFYLALDNGTTGSQCLLIDAETFQFIDTTKKEYPQIYPKPGWVEHNLDDIWHTIEVTTKTMLEKHKISPEQIKAIGITNQRETTCAFDKNGKALANAIVWQDRRTSERCLLLKNEESKIKAKTGLPIDPYFSGTKMEWLLNHSLPVKEAGEIGNLKFGTIDSFLLYRLTGNSVHATEPSNASRTLLYNLNTGDWDDELLKLFNIKREYLPKVQDTFSHFGKTKGLSFLPDGIPITCLFGDQQSALFGQGVFEKGGMKCTYGTGAFLLLNIGTEFRLSQNGLLTTVAYQFNGKKYYALEGSSYICGAAVQWLRDNLNLFSNSSEVENLARKITNLEQVENLLFYPYFSGIGSPHWKPEAKAAILGLSRDSKNEHLSYACLEGIALSIFELVQAFEHDSSTKIQNLNVDGGATKNNLLMQMQANILNANVIRPQVTETTGYGAAMGAAIGLGATTLDKIKSLVKIDKTFNAETNHHAYYEKKKMMWSKNLKALYL